MINLLNRVNSLCFYRDSFTKPIFEEFYSLLQALGQPEPQINEARKHFFELRSKLADYSLTIQNPKAKTPWKNFIISILLSDNTTTQSLEKDKNFLFKQTLINDLEIFSQLYKFNFSMVIDRLDPESPNIFNSEIYSQTDSLGDALENGEGSQILDTLKACIEQEGLGEFSGKKIFSINQNYKEQNLPILKPITIRNTKTMDDLVGYQRQKDRLIQNTKAFVEGKGGLHTLLYGEMGTGKSTMVKALSDTFKETPLRFIELKKDQVNLIPEIYSAVEKTNYPFILFLDDLSFDEGDSSYKQLKNQLEGSFEQTPANLLIYATSNKRTLISQSKSEREDAVNAREILEEKLSLVSRFGLTLSFVVPNQSSYLKIVESLAQNNGIKMTDELKEQAIQWELRHMNRSGRTAEQFVQYLLTQ